MIDTERSAQAFEANRSHLRAVAYHLLGSIPEAEDAVQEAWFRLARSDAEQVRDLRAWLTTVVARVALDMLRSRAARRESPFQASTTEPPDDLTGIADTEIGQPEMAAVQADAVGVAMLVVLETLRPAERLAFVLHDVFGVPFDQIGEITGRSTSAAKQLASRARRRVRQQPSVPTASRARQRQMLDAFLAAAAHGNFERLVALLDPDVVLRVDAGLGSPLTQTVRGQQAVAAQAKRYAGMAAAAQQIVLDGTPALLVAPEGRPFAVLSVRVQDDRIVEMHILADAERLAVLDLNAPAPEDDVP